jgi:hypothetical protein
VGVLPVLVCLTAVQQQQHRYSAVLEGDSGGVRSSSMVGNVMYRTPSSSCMVSGATAAAPAVPLFETTSKVC